MRTRKFFFVCAMSMLLCSNMIAQPAANNNDKKQQRPTPEQMLDHQAKAMQQRLLLDEQKAAEFAPLYKEYLKALQECRTVQKQDKKQELTDAEIEQRIENGFAAEKKVITTKETYFKKFKKILNAKQLDLVFRERMPMQGQPKNFRPGNNQQRRQGQPGQPQMPQQPNK